MADLSIVAGATSQSIEVDLYVLATGAPQTGLVYNSSGLIAAYAFATAAPVAITLATLASNTAAYSSGGFYEKDATKSPGLYRLDLPTGALAAASGREVVISITGYSGMATRHIKIELTGWDNQNATNGGMSALPATSCTTNASLLTSGTSADQISVSSGKVLLQATQSGVTIPTVTTVTNQLTAAAIATGVWQDATSGDFTVSGSIGMSLYTSGNAPGAASGLFIAGTNAATSITTALTANITGNLSGSVGSVTGAVGSVTGAVGSVTGNVGGNLTGSIGSLGATAKTDVSTAVLTTTMTESYPALNATATLAQAIYLTMQTLGQFSISGTTITAQKLDGSTTAATYTLDSSSTPTSRTRAS